MDLITFGTGIDFKPKGMIMNKKLIAGLLMLGSSVGVANAGIVSTSSVAGTHIASNINQIETYFIQANSTGNVDIFLQSQETTYANWPDAGSMAMDGLLSVWQLSNAGNLWTLMGGNDNAGRISPYTTTTVYGTNVVQPDGSPGGGFADPGLTLNLTSGNKYMIVQSENLNGPTSLANGQIASGVTNYETSLAGTLGQTIAVASSTPGNYTSAFKGAADLSGIGDPYSFSFNYTLYLNGNTSFIAEPAAISAVPVPGAVWLFVSALAGFSALGRKKTKSNLVA